MFLYVLQVCMSISEQISIVKMQKITKKIIRLTTKIHIEN